MEQYIPKSALVAEIEKLKGKVNDVSAYCNGWRHALRMLELSINTLEVKEVPIWEKVSPDTGQTTLYKDGGKSYLERFGYRIDLKDLDKLPKKNPKAQKGEKV